MKNFIRFWFPVVLYSGIIFYISSQESVDTPQTVPHFDKVCHLAEYTLYAFLLARALWNSFSRLDKRALIFLTTIGAMLYGVSDEFHQSFVAGREADALDVLADTLGGLIGGLVYTYYKSHNIKKNT